MELNSEPIDKRGCVVGSGRAGGAGGSAGGAGGAGGGVGGTEMAPKTCVNPPAGSFTGVAGGGGGGGGGGAGGSIAGGATSTGTANDSVVATRISSRLAVSAGVDVGSIGGGSD